MKKVLASLSLIAAISCPVFAQGISDTTFGDSGTDVQLGSVSENENLASLPGAFTAPVDQDAIGIGAGPNPGAEMNLTDDQLEKIAKIKNAFADTAGSKKLQVQSLNRELRSLMTQEKIDRSAVLDLQKKINDLNAELATSKVSMRLDALNVLSTEQRQKIHHKALQKLVFGGGQKRPGMRPGAGMRHGGMRGGHQFKRGIDRSSAPGADNTPTADNQSSLPPA